MESLEGLLPMTARSNMKYPNPYVITPNSNFAVSELNEQSFLFYLSLRTGTMNSMN
jgi:hypothetical protein